MVPAHIMGIHACSLFDFLTTDTFCRVPRTKKPGIMGLFQLPCSSGVGPSGSAVQENKDKDKDEGEETVEQ